MQEIKEEKKLPDKNKKKVRSFLPFRTLCRNMKRFFLVWLVGAAGVAALTNGINISREFTDREITVSVNFSFDGVESGNDPSGNKFEIKDIKKRSAIEATLKELGYEGIDSEKIYSSISIVGNVPSNVIERIIQYTSMYGSSEVLTSKKIHDQTYYPTQYKVKMECNDLDLNFDECVIFLNALTERYRKTFFNSYGYKESLENAVTSINYEDYDYIEAIDAFNTSLTSLKNYIDELVKKDNVRFRSSKSGYTFSDLSKSIDTIINEDLDIASSYIVVHNVTRDKENLIANYKYKIAQYEQRKSVCEQKYAAINTTIEEYKKNSVLINSTNGKEAEYSQSSDTYDSLVEDAVETKKQISSYEQKIVKYTDRINRLKDGKITGSEDKVKEDFKKLNDKVDKLLEAVEVTASEYYEEEVLSNAYKIISPATDSTWSYIKLALEKSVESMIAYELVLLAAYITLCIIIMNKRADSAVVSFFGRFKKMTSRKKASDEKKNKKEDKNGRK